jgi:hypothetical protein
MTEKDPSNIASGEVVENGGGNFSLTPVSIGRNQAAISPPRNRTPNARNKALKKEAFDAMILAAGATLSIVAFANFAPIVVKNTPVEGEVAAESQAPPSPAEVGNLTDETGPISQSEERKRDQNSLPVGANGDAPLKDHVDTPNATPSNATGNRASERATSEGQDKIGQESPSVSANPPGTPQPETREANENPSGAGEKQRQNDPNSPGITPKGHIQARSNTEQQSRPQTDSQAHQGDGNVAVGADANSPATVAPPSTVSSPTQDASPPPVIGNTAVSPTPKLEAPAPRQPTPQPAAQAPRPNQAPSPTTTSDTAPQTPVHTTPRPATAAAAAPGIGAAAPGPGAAIGPTTQQGPRSQDRAAPPPAGGSQNQAAPARPTTTAPQAVASSPPSGLSAARRQNWEAVLAPILERMDRAAGN